jgi:hypothetical protein
VQDNPVWADALVLVTDALFAGRSLAFPQWELQPQADWDQHQAALCRDLRAWWQGYQL